MSQPAVQLTDTERAHAEGELGILMNNFGYGPFQDGQNRRRIEQLQKLLGFDVKVLIDGERT